MTTIGITGAAGLIGYHVHAFLKGIPDVSTRIADRTTFADRASLETFVSGCDAIVHLAGMNRGDDKEILETNLELANHLAEALESSNSKSHLLFSSSTHIERETAYGRSKRAATARFEKWAQSSGGRFTNLILPHVFGEFGKPFYNSVVSTFCHQIARGEASVIDHDGQLELLHAQQVAECIWHAIHQQTTGEVRVQGVPIRVSELLEKLRAFSHLYMAQQVPQFRERFDLLLFNTYRSYLYPDHYPVSLKMHSDNRGSLFEAVKSLNGGQTFVSWTLPGFTRGNHYHRHKVERFLVISGDALIRIRKVLQSHTMEFRVSGTEPQFVDMPTLHTHNITNIGSTPLLTLFWAHEIFDPSNSDTFAEVV